METDLEHSKSNLEALKLNFSETVAQLSQLKDKEKDFDESRYERINLESEIEGLKGLLIKKMDQQATNLMEVPEQTIHKASENQDLAISQEKIKSSIDSNQRQSPSSEVPLAPSNDLESINQKISELAGLNGQLIKENEALKQDNFTLKGKLRFCLSTYINPNEANPELASIKLGKTLPAPSRETNLIANQ